MAVVHHPFAQMESQIKKKKVVPLSPLPYQCCLKQNVDIVLSIWIDKSGFVVSLFQDPAITLAM